MGVLPARLSASVSMVVARPTAAPTLAVAPPTPTATPRRPAVFPPTGAPCRAARHVHRPAIIADDYLVHHHTKLRHRTAAKTSARRNRLGVPSRHCDVNFICPIASPILLGIPSDHARGSCAMLPLAPSAYRWPTACMHATAIGVIIIAPCFLTFSNGRHGSTVGIPNSRNRSILDEAWPKGLTPLTGWKVHVPVVLSH